MVFRKIEKTLSKLKLYNLCGYQFFHINSQEWLPLSTVHVDSLELGISTVLIAVDNY